MTVSAASIRALAGLLQSRTGQTLAMSRTWRIETALQPLLRERGLSSIDALAAAVVSGREHGLQDIVVDALLNNETYFFRDHAVFDLLDGTALELLRESRAVRKRLRIWSAGCSTGQEAYTLAMLFASKPERWRGWSIDILATDVSGEAIARARDGVFSQFEIQRGLPVRMMVNWFDQSGENWTARRELKRYIRFRRHSLLDEPLAPGRFDLILCRNVLIYFPAEARRLTFDQFADSIEPDGILMLGAGETILGQTDRFVSDRGLRGLYRPKGFQALH